MDSVVTALLLLGAVVALFWLVYRALSFTPAHAA